jgi:SepF-like predicted cell division protein (DUF552 family)
MLPALAGFAAKALLPSKKKVDKGKFFDKKESSAIVQVGEGDAKKSPTIKKKTISTAKFLSQPDIKALPPAAEVNKGVKGGKLNNIFDRIGETLQGIIDALKNRDKTQKEEEKTKREEAKVDEKKEREEKLEKEAKKKPFKKPNIKAPEDKFNLMRFFGNILLGSLALAIFKNLEQIIETLKNVFQTIKDFITKLGEFFSPVWNGLKWIVGEGTKLIGQLLGIPPENLDEKDILKNLNEIKDKIPFLKNLFEGINRTIESLRSGRGLTPPQSGGAGGGGTSTPGSLGSAPPGTVLSTGAKTTYYDPSLGGINASGYKTAQGLPATSTGEGYRANVFSAAAFPPLLAKLPSSMTTPAAGFPGGRTLKRPFNVIVTNSQGKKAVVRVNDVGPGVKGHSQNHMLDLSVAAKNYLGTGGGFTIEMAASDATPGPLTGISPQQQKADEMAIESSARAAAPTAPTSTFSPGQSTAPAASGQLTPQAQVSPTSAQPAPQAQVSPTQAPPAVSASVPQIMQQAEYEVPGGTASSTILPIPIGGGAAPMVMGGGTRLLPVGVSKQALLNSYYQAQLTGFLYKQG